MSAAAAPGGDDARRLSRRSAFDALVAAHKGRPTEGIVEKYAAERGLRPDDPYWEGAAPYLLAISEMNAAAVRLKKQVERIGRKELPDDHTAFSHALAALPEPYGADLARYQKHLGPVVPLDDQAWYTIGAMMIGVRAVANTSNDIRKVDVEMRAEIAKASKGVAQAQQLGQLLETDIEVGHNHSRALRNAKTIDRSFATIAAVLAVVIIVCGGVAEWRLIENQDQCSISGELISAAASNRSVPGLRFAINYARAHGCAAHKV